MTQKPTRPSLSIPDVASAALCMAEAILAQELPGGKRVGREWEALNPTRADNRTGSFKVNINTGLWSDFADPANVAKGGDLVSLMAYLLDTTQLGAASYINERYLHGSAARQMKKPPEKKRKNRTWTPILPVPENAPPPPKAHIKRGVYAKHWAYLDGQGALLGYVCRFEKTLDDGTVDKDIIPLVYCEADTGERGWQWRAFEAPRPLYGLNWLVALPEESVLVVEGEKCANAARILMGAGVGPESMHVPVTWPGGCKAVGKADFTPLAGRDVVLWPDNDEPGRAAMLAIAETLRDVAKSVTMLKIPEGRPQGWDIADAVDEGWDAARLVEFIEGNADAAPPEPPKEQDTAAIAPPEPPKGGKGGAKKEATPSVTLDEAPFRCLGHDRGMYYYLPGGTHQVVELPANNHTTKNLLALAPLSWWMTAYPGERGPGWSSAINALFRKCEKVGIYDTRRVRGCGAWFDEGRVVLHLGDHLLVDGERASIEAFSTRYIYEAAPPMSYSSAEPLDAEGAGLLLKAMRCIAWEKPVYGDLLAGWCFIATVCGALSWRPHLWITGGRGTGKTWIIEQIVRPLLGSAALVVQANTTEAGVRQSLGHNAFPVLFDEAEGEDRHAQRRIQNVLELMRQASSETGAMIIKGTQGGRALSYRIRSSFCLASIGVPIQQAADASRITVLSLGRFHEKDRADYFDMLTELVGKFSREWCSGMRSRAVRMIPVVRHNAEVFARSVADQTGNRRAGDQLGALLAGAWALGHDGEIDDVEADKYVAGQAWIDDGSSDEQSDEDRCLSHILQHTMRVAQDGRTLDRTVVRLLALAAGIISDDDIPGEVKMDDAELVLLRMGIRHDKVSGTIVVSSSHISLARILQETPWATGWARILGRIDGAVEKTSVRFEHGTRTRAVCIPMDYVFTEADKVP